MKLNLKPSMVALATWLGIGASETERQVELTEAQTEQWEAEIKELGDLRTQVKTLTETATTNATALTAIAKERDEYKTKADEYGKQPGQVAGAAVVKAEDPAIDAKEEPYLTSVDKEKASLKAKGQI